MTPCACCNAVEIKGPFIGPMQGKEKLIHLYQCWGDWDGMRCNNTRALEVREVTPEEVKEGEG